MKLLVDAQLPRRLIYRFREAGYDCIHTLDLPDKNRTTDDAIIAIANQEERIVVTKDADFVSTLLLYGRPKKLLLISTGNITNSELEQLLCASLPKIAEAFTTNAFIEITRSALIWHY